MTKNQTVYVVSGSNRGIGFNIVDQLSKDSQNVIFAGARNPSAAKELNAIASERSNLHVVQLRADSAEDCKAVAEEVKAKVGKVDVLIANAGINGKGGPIATTDIADLQELISVNTIGPLLLFQATHALLAEDATIAVTSSALGSIGHQLPDFPVGAYCISKTAVNQVIGRIAAEHPHLRAAAIHPGLVSTDMAADIIANMDDATKKAWGVLTPAESGERYIKNIEKIKQEKPGKAVFLGPDGKEIPW